MEFGPLRDVKGNPVGPKPDWQIEIEVLRLYDSLKAQGAAGMMPWEEHFKRLVTIIWGRPECTYKFTWNPIADKCVKAARQWKFLGLAGHASSGKSQVGAIWAIVHFLLDPEHTKVFITSTTLEESRMRIWGVIEKYWEELVKFMGPFGVPGKMVSSRGKIRYNTADEKSELSGLALIAGGKGQDSEASTKIGFKAKKVILIGDELPLLTHKLYEAAKGNLFSNPDFQFIGIGNLTSIFDPFGIFTEPKDGWDSITEEMPGWETKLGYCLRFDGEKSPNVLAGKELYPGLLTLEKVMAYREMLGEKSAEYYRMVKSFPSPTGLVGSIYEAAELTASMAARPVNNWLEAPTPIAFLDPAFSHGGDEASARFAKVGTVNDNGKIKKVVESTDVMNLLLRVDAKHKTKDRNEQLADLFIEECEKRGVAIPDRGIDSTGGGDPFSTILAMKMGQGFQMIGFGGAPSDKPVSSTDRRTGKERFVNRVSELWYVGKELNKDGQLKGLDAATMMEMCARTYEEQGGKVRVEEKKKMKERTNGRSPDKADSWMGVIEIARRRHGLSSSARSAAKVKPVNPFGGEFSDMFDWAKKKKPMVKDEEPVMMGGGWGD